MYLLDTNVVSELRKPGPHGAVVAWINSVDDGSLHLATVTLGEIQAAISGYVPYSTQSSVDNSACRSTSWVAPSARSGG